MSNLTFGGERPVVAHFKDAFLPLSETFVYPLVSRLDRYQSIVVDRHQRQNRQAFPFEDYYSVAEKRGPWYAKAERLTLRYLGRSPYLERVLKGTSARIIHAHFGQLGALITPVARRLGLPLVVSFYGKDLSIFVQDPRWKSRFDRLWQDVHTVVALGDNMVSQLERAGCSAHKLVILPIAIDLERVQYVERVPPEPDATIHLLAVGRLVDKKGFDVALRAVSSLAGSLNIHLSIAGEGPERANLEELARQLNVRHKTSFLGWLNYDQFIAEMSKADLFVLPSRSDRKTGETEGTPTVLLEAQATGLPVVSTLHAGIPDIVQHGQSGWLVPENNPRALAMQLREILAKSPEWAEVSRRARLNIERNHSLPVVVARLEKIYDACLQ